MAATLAESIAATLRQKIIDGIHVSGDRLVEINLARDLNVSQNTIRDALRLLERDGWVVKVPRRGVYVRKFTADEAAELCALVTAVERVALGYALEKLTRARMNKLRKIMSSARKQQMSGDWNGAIEALFALHLLIGEIADRPLTAELLEQLFNRLRLLEGLRQARAPRRADELAAQIAMHEKLLKVMEASDSKAAGDLLSQIITAYEAILLPVL
jgi:DNA-binding GntR family transcriptional regulator